MIYQNGTISEETVEKKALLTFLYSKRLGRVCRKIVATKTFSKLIGAYYRSRISKRGIHKFIKKHSIDQTEIEKPLQDYRCFNDFFIRKLKPTARPINQDSSVIVSPADARMLAFSPITKQTSFFVKGVTCNLAELIQDEKIAQEYENGTLFVLRLAPSDYHRFHFPIDCIPRNSKKISGIYESVNPLVYKKGIQPLLLNKRECITLSSEHVSNILFIPVGALCVGSIKTTFKTNTHYSKGDEAGYFEFGGSTIILLFKPGTIEVDEALLQRSAQGIETIIKVGEKIAKSM